METILNFFARLAPFIYILLAVGLILGIRRLFLARLERREAIYGLEREVAQHHSNQAVTSLVLITCVGLAEFVLIVFLQPNLPAIFKLATPTNSLLTPAATLPLVDAGTQAALTPGANPAPSGVGCVPGKIDITSPKTGDEVKGVVTLTGSVAVPDLGFFKYEYASLGSDSWSAVEAGRDPVTNGRLGDWDTTNITPGDYQLRLVVSDNQGNQFPPCVITIRVKAP